MYCFCSLTGNCAGWEKKTQQNPVSTEYENTELNHSNDTSAQDSSRKEKQRTGGWNTKKKDS